MLWLLINFLTHFSNVLAVATESETGARELQMARRPTWPDRMQKDHESINSLTPADVYFGRGQSILKQRESIKRKTMETRRLQYRKYAA